MLYSIKTLTQDNKNAKYTYFITITKAKYSFYLIKRDTSLNSKDIFVECTWFTENRE